jgi:hypothetical protein
MHGRWPRHLPVSPYVQLGAAVGVCRLASDKSTILQGEEISFQGLGLEPFV